MQKDESESGTCISVSHHHLLLLCYFIFLFFSFFFSFWSLHFTSETATAFLPLISSNRFCVLCKNERKEIIWSASPRLFLCLHAHIEKPLREWEALKEYHCFSKKRNKKNASQSSLSFVIISFLLEGKDLQLSFC